jgi:signal transduction histidine kinase
VGLWQYVEKPWDTAELLIKVRQGLERRDLVRNLERTNTELAARLAELETARERLVRSERLAAVGRVMSGLAHEIGNQLGLLGYAELILQKTQDPDVAEYARLILQGQQRLTNMIAEIKDFTRGTDGSYARQPADLAGVVEEALSVLRFDREVQGRRVAAVVEAHPIVRVNRGKLIQVIINLVRNAAQASPGGREVRVIVEGTPEGGGRVRVVDEGEGIPPEVLARLGEPFYTTREGGTGLGLGISRRIVEEHGGELAIRSQPGKGTEVDVRLPAPEQAPAAAPGGHA